MNKKILHPEISYEITGISFKTHKNLGRFRSERQYCDEFERLLREKNIPYKREYKISTNNRVDFLIRDTILVDIKAKKFITKEDYFQMQRYLDIVQLELGLIINFRNTHLKPKRVLNFRLYSDNSDVNSPRSFDCVPSNDWDGATRPDHSTVSRPDHLMGYNRMTGSDYSDRSL